MKSEWLSSTSLRKENHKDFIATFCKESPSYSTLKRWAAAFKKGEIIENDERSGGPEVATADENVKVVRTTVMCNRRRDLRSITSKVGHKFWGSTINPNRHLRYVKGFGKMVAANVDR